MIVSCFVGNSITALTTRPVQEVSELGPEPVLT